LNRKYKRYFAAGGEKVFHGLERGGFAPAGAGKGFAAAAASRFSGAGKAAKSAFKERTLSIGSSP